MKKSLVLAALGLCVAAVAIVSLSHASELHALVGTAGVGGAYVAMAVVTGYGNGYKDPAAINAVNAIFAEAQARVITSKINITNGDSANSKFYIGKLPSNALIDPGSAYYHEAVAGVTDLDVGFANDPDALVDGDDVSSAGSQTLAGHGTLTPPNMAKKVWELAGLSSDPGGTLDVFATLKAAASATKSITFVLRYGKA